MADRTINRDGGVKDGQFFHPLISSRQAKLPVGRTVEMYLADVLSKITYIFLNNNLTDSGYVFFFIFLYIKNP